MNIGVANTLVEQLSDSALELGRDLLGLVTDVHLRHTCLRGLVRESLLLELDLLIALEQTGQHTDKGCLAGSILSEQDNDLRISKLSLHHMQDELRSTTPHGLGHIGVAVIAHHILLAAIILGTLGYLERERIIAESKVLRGNISGQEGIDTNADTEGHGNDTVTTGGTVQDADVVTEIVQNGKVVLHDEDVATVAVLIFNERTDHVGGRQPLLDVEVGRGLIEHVHIRHLYGDGGNGETLELATGKHADLTVHDMLELGLCRGPIEAVKVLSLTSL